jgi:hypothetical protein
MHEVGIRTGKEGAFGTVVPSHSVMHDTARRYDLEDLALARQVVDVSTVDNDLVSDVSLHLYLLVPGSPA